ncbi:MAG TPA: regulatory protein RecX [Solirubrobacteraceae bacterium]
MSRSALRAGEAEASVVQRALELVHRYIDRRERTVSEVRGHLLSHEIDEAVAAAVIEELVERGYLDDARFARLFAEDKRTLEQWGSERIRRALMIRGVDRDLADAALVSGGDGEQVSEIDRALQVLRQRFPNAPRGRRERERALGLLFRRGYEPELAIDALRAHAHDCE